jgi:hypothetical protein
MSVEGLLYFELDTKGNMIRNCSALCPHDLVPLAAAPSAQDPVVPPRARDIEVRVDLGTAPQGAASPIPDFTFDDDPFSITWNFADDPLTFGDDVLT